MVSWTMTGTVTFLSLFLGWLAYPYVTPYILVNRSIQGTQGQPCSTTCRGFSAAPINYNDPSPQSWHDRLHNDQFGGVSTAGATREKVVEEHLWQHVQFRRKTASPSHVGL
jgi:hypothetical protein